MADLSYNAFQSGNTPPVQGGLGGFINNNIVNPIKNAFSGGINQIQEGANQIGSGQNNPIVAGTEGALKIGAGITGAVFSPLAPVIQRPVGAAINAIGNQVSNIPAVQNFANSPIGQTTARVAGDLSNAGAVAGGILGTNQAVETGGNVWNKAYSKVTGPSAVDTAQADLNTQAGVTANSLQNATEDLSNYRNTTMGQQFAQSAQKVMEVDPNARMVVPNDIMEKLNELKDTAKFQLPDYLRTSSPEFGNNIKLGDIEKGGQSLNPVETQDLIGRINKLTYDAKASGDLKVNQSTVGLVNDLHNIASDAFGHVKDTNGNSVFDTGYKNFSQQANVVSKMSDLINIDKNAGPMDMFNKLNAFKKLLDDPSGKVLLQNAVDELKQTTGVDLTNTTGEVQKLMESEDFFKNAQKPGFLKQMLSPSMVGRLGMRVIMYATLGAWIKSAIKGISG